MASTFNIPSSLKLSQLKQLAFKCGLKTTGTKTILHSRLHHEITTATLRPAKSGKILSIDMGIRNLAYCVLKTPSLQAQESQKPTLDAWYRLAVSQAPSPKTATDGSKDIEVEKEAFDPATLSRAAYSLLRERLLIHKPAYILIERQRFRSNGSAHILEWTVRVNMLESILYAILHTLRAEGIWEGTVMAIAPGKVGPFWVGEAVETAVKEKKEKVRKSKAAKIQNKGAKIDLVGNWLHGGDILQLGNKDVERIAKAYSEKWDWVSTGKRREKVELEPGEEKMGKLDDLADCLLQGMAWIQWEENKRLVLKQGVDALLSS